MPYESYGCNLCGEQAPARLREHGTFDERMKWLREHYKAEHPAEFKKRFIRKTTQTKRQRGLINGHCPDFLTAIRRTFGGKV